SNAGIEAAVALSRDYPKARLTFSGFTATALTRFARLGGHPERVYVESRPQTTFEDALYSAALLKPKPGERWLLVTLAVHMPRAVGCFRLAGFEVEPYPVAIRTASFVVTGTAALPVDDSRHVGAAARPAERRALPDIGSAAFIQLDAAAKEWIGLVAYRLMGRTDALFPGPPVSVL